MRRLGPDAQGHTAYVLPRDVVPIGAQQARVEDWFIDAERQASAAYDQDRQRIVRQNPIPLLGFDDDELVVPSSDLRARVIAAARRGGSGRVEISPKELTPEQQKVLLDSHTRRAQDLAKDLAQEEGYPGTQGNSFNFRLDRVFISFDPWLGLIVPGMGEITTDPLESLRDWFPPAPTQETPLDLAGKTLAARITTEAEASDAVAEAARIKAAALWRDADPPVLVAAVKAGKAAGVPVGALVPLLTRAGTPDINLLGEDSAAYAKRRWNRESAPLWCAPDDPAARSAALKRVREEAAIPGLAVLVLRDALPPGYRDIPPVNHDSDIDSDPISYREGAAATLGYSLEHRLAFLREKALDPADIILGSITPLGEAAAYERSQVLFGVGGAAADDWAVWRREIAQSLLNDARATVRAAAPDLPLVLTGYTTWRYSTGPHTFHADWFTTWPDSLKDAPDLFRLAPVDADQFRPRAARTTPANTRSKGAPIVPAAKVWLALGGLDASLSPTDLLRQAGQGWDGFVFDLSYLPWPEAKKRLTATEVK